MSIVINKPVKLAGVANKRKCTVLLSSYNGEKYIKEQVDSILNQSFVDVYLVIRDDGSKDGTIDILKQIRDEYPQSVKLIQGKNIGIHRSFRELFIDAECFSYIAFADQDDIWDKDKLITAILCMEKNKADFYSCASRLVDEKQVATGVNTSNPRKYKYYMCGNSKLMTPGAQGCTIVLSKRACDILQNRYYPPNYGHDTWLTVASYYLFNCIYDSNTHMSYRQHNSSWTGNRTQKYKHFFVNVRFFLLGLARYKPLAKDILKAFGEDLSNKDYNCIKAVSGENTNIIKRIKFLFRFDFGKYGFLEDLMYKLYYILGL